MQVLFFTVDIYPQKTTAVAHLNGGGAESEELVSGSLCVSIHVDQNVDSILVNTISCFAIARNLQVRGASFSKIVDFGIAFRNPYI